MNIQGKTIWQQACGDTNHFYGDVCLSWDVILNGPGEFGAYPQCDNYLRNNWSTKKADDIERFASTMKSGDLVLLRLGTNQILGVGELQGGYLHHEDFGDIDGWTLQHVRRVKWLWNGSSNPQHFQTYALKQGDTTQPFDQNRVGANDVVKWLTGLNVSSGGILTALPTNDDRRVSPQVIGEYLFEAGISGDNINMLLSHFDELQRIAKWYNKSYPSDPDDETKHQSHLPTEAETRAYLAIPLLRALGWTPQRMAIEWNNIDIALFSSLPRADSSLSIVVETKKLGNAILPARAQASGYAKTRASCRRLIVTDGMRYGVYVRNCEEEFDLQAYMNLTLFKSDYPILGCKGITEALRLMSPDWHP